MAKVRLTIRPDEERDIPDDEIPGLRAQGLLVEDETPAEPPAEPPPARKPKPSDQQGA